MNTKTRIAEILSGNIEQASQSPAPRRSWGRKLMRSLSNGFSMASFSTNRLTQNWVSTPTPADDFVERNQRVLVARSRDQALNNDYGRKFLQMCTQNIVGPEGVRLQAKVRAADGSLDEAMNDAVERAFTEWSKRGTCDVTGKLSFREFQEACVTAACQDGEFFVRLVPAGEWGLQLHLIDAQRCPVDYSVARYTRDTFIRQGIEFNEYGRPLAYHFSATDAETNSYFYGGRNFVRVPADQILHGFVSQLTGQKRGLPWMSTSLMRMRMLGGLEDSALVNARVSAAKQGFFEWDPEHAPATDPYEEDEEEYYMEAEPGTFRELPVGMSFKGWDPNYPNGEYASFHKSVLRGIASGLGVSYHSLANDLSDVNFSSARQGLIEERDRWRTLQSWLIESLLGPVFAEWLPRALLAGRIVADGATVPASRIDDLSEHGWQPRRWQWVDPRADSNAAIMQKNNLLASPSQLIREQGRDPATVWREVAADIAAMKSAGIPEELIQAAVNSKIGQQNVTGNQPEATNDTADE